MMTVKGYQRRPGDAQNVGVTSRSGHDRIDKSCTMPERSTAASGTWRWGLEAATARSGQFLLATKTSPGFGSRLAHPRDAGAECPMAVGHLPSELPRLLSFW